VTGQDFQIRLHPSAFYSSRLKDNRGERDAGVQVHIRPNTGISPESGQTVLSGIYQIEAYAYVGQSKTQMLHLASSIQITLDVDQNKANMRRIRTFKLMRYDGDKRKWDIISEGRDGSAALTGTTEQLGTFAIIGSRER